MSETQIGQLVIDLRVKTEALEKGLETARKELQKIEKQNEQVKNSNKSLDANFIAMSISVVASLSKIKSAVDDGVNKYNSYVNSMKALQKTAKATNNSMADVEKAIKDVNKLKLMDDSDVTAATKNLLTYGFTVEQTSDILKVLQDAAVGNRQASYSLSEAVRVTTEGIRMENSVLSDAAGVQKNISKMYEEHAKEIGKTTDSLTQAEKAQAVYNGIMNEASMFTGSATEMAAGYQGTQAQLNASSLELSRTLGEAMIPTLNEIDLLRLKITQGLSIFIKENKGATAGVLTFITTLGTLTLGIVAVVKSIQTCKKAMDALKASSDAVKISMAATFAVSTIIATISAITTAIQEQKNAQEELRIEQEKYNQVMNDRIPFTDENINSMQTKLNQMQSYLDKLEEWSNIYFQKETIDVGIDKTGLDEEQLNALAKAKEDLTNRGIALHAELVKEDKEFKELFEITKKGLLSYEDLEGIMNVYNQRLKEANAIQKISKILDIESTKNMQQEAAQLKINANQMQEYLNIVKKGDKTTEEYQNAISVLAKTYPEAANAEGILIDQAQGFIDAEVLKADEAWKSSQDTINSYIEIINTAFESERVQEQIAQRVGKAWTDIAPSLQSVLGLLQAMAGYKPEDVKLPETYTPPKTTPRSSSTGSKSYSNERLDNYKKEIEHKKALDQLSLQEEIAMYEKALKSYAKTQDEKWELEEKIYDLRKEAQEKEYSDYTAFVEHKKAIGKKSLEEEINDYEWAYKNLAKTTEQKQELEEKLYDLRNELQEKNLDDYISEIQYKKSMDKISLKQEIEMYEKALKVYAKTAEQKKEIRQTLYELNKEMAQKEKALLDQQTEDYEIYMQKQKNLLGASYDVKEQTKDYDKIIEIHKNYLKEIMKDERLSLEERKELYREELATIRSYEEQKRNLRVESIDNTVSQLTNAITKQLEEMQEKDKELIDKNLEAVEKWKNARIEAINEEYDARIEAINKELEALNKAEQQKTREEEDAEYERKKKRLEELIAFEHDAVTKANYQKELDKLIEEYQKTLDKRALDDKKEALNTQKELLKEEQDSKVQAVEEEAEKKTEIYDKQLEKLEAYYDKQIDKAQETAEKMLLNVGKNQDDILKLLKKYGNKYELTGQSLGEKLAQGINEGLAGKIESFIQKFQDTIDRNLEAKIKEWTASNYKYEPKANKPQSKTVSITQINKIEQNPEMPSETYRKLNNVSRKLAEEFAGM